MSDTDNTPTESAPAAATPEVASPAQETFTKDYVQELRNEAANYRNRAKTAAEEARNEVKAEYEAKLADKDVEKLELQNQLGQAWIELEKVYTAIEANIPSNKVRAFAAILQGDNADSIKESAKTAADLFGGLDNKGPAIDPTQGKGGTPLPLNGDPLLNALKKVVGA